MERESWDEYFLRMAKAASSRSTCLRRHVGAVLVQDKAVRGTGYNGAPRGVPSCLDLDECLLDESGRCIRTIHAEANLILQTDTKDREGATVYITDFPCWRCALLLANSGIKEIVYDQEYGAESKEVRSLMRDAGVHLRNLR